MTALFGTTVVQSMIGFVVALKTYRLIIY